MNTARPKVSELFAQKRVFDRLRRKVVRKPRRAIQPKVVKNNNNQRAINHAKQLLIQSQRNAKAKLASSGTPDVFPKSETVFYGDLPRIATIEERKERNFHANCTPTFVVSIRKQRWENCKNRLGNLAGLVKRWNCVDGRSLNIPNMYKTGKIAPGCVLSRGEIGCYMSHATLLKHIGDSKSNFESAMIMEDDIKIFDNTKSEQMAKLSKALSELETKRIKWDILYLYLPSDKKVSVIDPTLQYWKKIVDGLGLPCIIIKRVAAKRISQHMFPIRGAVDHHVWYTAKSLGMKIYGLRINIGGLADIVSDTVFMK